MASETISDTTKYLSWIFVNIMAITLSGSSTSLVQWRPTDIIFFFYDDFIVPMYKRIFTYLDGAKGSSISLQGWYCFLARVRGNIAIFYHIPSSFIVYGKGSLCM